MLTTVPSMRARAEPSTVARSTQRPADSSYRTSRAATGPVGIGIDIGPTATGRGRTRPECDQRAWLGLSISTRCGAAMLLHDRARLPLVPTDRNKCDLVCRGKREP